MIWINFRNLGIKVNFDVYLAPDLQEWDYVDSVCYGRDKI